MITNFGKNLISKYLVGQIDNYANYIAVGVGSTTPAATQKSLDFEVARFPVISKGVSTTTSGIIKKQLVFTAQTDSLDRLSITEVGLYPAGYDSLLSNSVGSKLLLDFSINEEWTYNNASSYNSPLIYVSNPLDYNNLLNNIDTQSDGGTTLKAYIFDANNSFFTNSYYSSSRIARGEQPRIYDSSLITIGDMSTTTTSGPYIEFNNFNKATDLDRASSTDELRVAFTVVNTTGSDSTAPTSVQFTIRFYTNDNSSYRDYLFDTSSSTTTTWTSTLGASTRYVIGKQLLSSGTSNNNFKWSAVNTVRIYAKVTHGTPSNYAIIFDGLRFENTSSTNPLYGLVGYSVPSSIITKSSDKYGLLEFRFNLGVS
jgi:hypothetical protein